VYFTEPLIRGIFVQRYKRFFVDAVIYDTGEQVVAHCANPGAMTGLCIPGATVWLLKNDDPKRKLKYTWEFIELLCGTLVGVNTMTPNRILQNVLEQGGLSVFSQYRTIKREVKQSCSVTITNGIAQRFKMFCSSLCHTIWKFRNALFSYQMHIFYLQITAW
jgi:sugar fermentation stimulation protein